MDGFFHDRRHQTGLIALVMALIVMVQWFRSQVVVDELSGGPLHVYNLQTDGGFIIFGNTHVEYCGELLLRCSASQNALSWSTRPRETVASPPDDAYQFAFGQMGLECLASCRIQRIGDVLLVITQTCWRASLIWVVLPLSLLSAYLLVIRRRSQLNKLTSTA